MLHAQGPEYVAAFYNVMPRCLKQALQTGDDKTKEKVRRPTWHAGAAMSRWPDLYRVPSARWHDVGPSFLMGCDAAWRSRLVLFHVCTRRTWFTNVQPHSGRMNQNGHRP